MTEQFSNFATTTLNGAIDNAVTSIVVTSATPFPSSSQYRITIDTEIMIVTGGAGTTTWTVTRGAESTSAASHANGAAVSHTLTSGGLGTFAPLASPTFTGTVTLPTGAVTSTMILDGTILNADVNASAAITGEKLLLSTFQPADHGLKFWSFDSVLKTANTVLTSGTLTLVKIKTPTAQTCTTVSLGVGTTPTGTLTTGQNLVAVCDPTGAQLGSTSADQTSSWASTGLKQPTVGSFTTTAGSFVYVIVLSVVGSLACPAFISTAAGINAITNVGLTAATFRAATNLTSQTSMSGLPLTLANNASIGTHLWAALS